MSRQAASGIHQREKHPHSGTALRHPAQSDLQCALEENPHYRYACGLGQLAPVEIQRLADDTEDGWQLYERGCLALGQKLGNIKLVALDPRPGWDTVFAAPSRAAQGIAPDQLPFLG